MVIIRNRRLPRESAGKSDGCIENQSLGPLIYPSSLYLLSLDTISTYLSLSAALFQHTCKYPRRSVEYLLQAILLAILIYHNSLDYAAAAGAATTGSDVLFFFNLVIVCVRFSQRPLTHLLGVVALKVGAAAAASCCCLFAAGGCCCCAVAVGRVCCSTCAVVAVVAVTGPAGAEVAAAAPKPKFAAALKLPCLSRLSIIESVVRNRSTSSCLSDISLISHSRISAARLMSSSE